MSPSTNQAKELINLQCQQPSSKISVNPRASPVQLRTQHTLVSLKGKQQSTQQEAEGANRAHSEQYLHLRGMMSQVLQQHSCRAIKTSSILLQQWLLIKTLLLIRYFIELGEEEVGLPLILLIFDSV